MTSRNALGLACLTAAWLAMTPAFASIPPARLFIGELTHEVSLPSPERSEVEGWTRETVTTLVEELSGGFRAYYEVHETGPRLSLIERRSSDGALIAFRHRYMADGEERWTGWLNPSLRDLAVSRLPEARSVERSAQLRPLRSGNRLKEATRELLQVSSRFELLNDSLPAPTAGISLEPGDHSWSYDAAGIKIWAGYLWDFKNGWLFRGYRKSDKEGEILTPSQNLNSPKLEDIRRYYSAFPSRFTEEYTVANSRWLSPLDKWGIRALRRKGEKWWISSGWEALHHFNNHDWGGYCNASTVLPFLWKKPARGVIDTDLLFDPRDLVGLIQVASYKVDYQFYGERYNGGTWDTLAEPAPHRVLELLRQYIGENKTPIIMDHEAGPAVGNVLALAARVKIEATADPLVRKGTLAIDNMGNMEDTLAAGKKDEEALVPDWTWGTDTKTYNFTIRLKADGSVQSSEWEKNDFHPDFFWIPTGIRDYGPPHTKNPYLPVEDVRELIRKSL